MKKIFISEHYGYEDIRPGDVLAFSRVVLADDTEDEAEIVSDDNYAEDDEIITFNNSSEDDKRIASVFMRVISVTFPVKKMFRRQRGNVRVELPNKQQVDLYDFVNHNNGVHMLSAEMEAYIRSVPGLESRMSVEARIESKKSADPDFFCLEVFNVNDDPSYFKKVFEKELEQRKMIVGDKQKEEEADRLFEEEMDKNAQADKLIGELFNKI